MGKQPNVMPQPSSDAVLIEQQATIMATAIDIHITAAAGQQDNARARIAACFSWLRQVEDCLTRFQSDSELCRLNAAAGSWFAVSEQLFTVLEESLAAATASGGLFDPTLLSLLEALGYDRDFKAIAFRETGATAAVGQSETVVARQEWRVAHRSPLTGAWRRIQLDKRHRRVRLPLGGHLDFGGIAKGWAADVALERFFADFWHVLINLGGDMRARGGCSDGTPWPIGVASSAVGPAATTAAAAQTVVTLGRGGLATSGAADRWWYRAGERTHHLLDPRTGRPATLWIDSDSRRISETGEPDRPWIQAATAFAPTAAHAEVAAKVALLRGYPTALEIVDGAWTALIARAGGDDGTASSLGALPIAPYGDEGVALLLTLETGAVVYSAHLAQYLNTLGGGGNLWLT